VFLDDCFGIVKKVKDHHDQLEKNGVRVCVHMHE
jgi:hypothetical protein